MGCMDLYFTTMNNFFIMRTQLDQFGKCIQLRKKFKIAYFLSILYSSAVFRSLWNAGTPPRAACSQG